MYRRTSGFCTSKSSHEIKVAILGSTTQNWPTDLKPISNKKNVDFLTNYLAQNTGFYLRGSPGAGKTSLSYDLQASFEKKEKVCWRMTSDHGHRDFVAQKATKPDLIIIDEFQSRLQQIDGGKLSEAVGECFKDGIPLACFGTTNLGGPQGVATPAEFTSLNLWMNAPTLDRQEIAEFSKGILQSYGVAVHNPEDLTLNLFNFCGGSMNVLMRILKFLVVENGPKKQKGVFPSIEDVLRMDDPPRAIVNGGEWWKSPKRDVVSALLTAGVVDVSADDEDLKDLVRTGFVSPIADKDPVTEDLPQLTKFDWRTELVTWNHPWQVAKAQMEGIKPDEVEWVVGADGVQRDPSWAVSTHPINALVFMLPFFVPENQYAQLYNSKAKTFSEDCWQLTLTHAFIAVFPNTVINKEVWQKTAGEDGRVDFVYSGNKSFELLIDNKGLKAHVDRYSSGKKYQDLGQSSGDWLVVNLERQPVFPMRRRSSYHVSANVATVSPHNDLGWGVIQLDYQGQRFSIARDKVPRFLLELPDGSTRVEFAQRRVVKKPDEYWVSVTLPDESVEAVDITPAVQNDKDISSNISGLKQVVKNVLADELQGIGVSHLIVYPPGDEKDGKAAITKMSTPLESSSEDKPYHVEVLGVSEALGAGRVHRE